MKTLTLTIALTISLSQPTIAAFNDPGTDYSVAAAVSAATTPWVSDPSNRAVALADIMACILSQSGVGLPGYANKDWVAYVNEQKCDLTDESDTTTYAKIWSQSSMASTSTPQDIVSWVEFTDGSRFVVNSQVSANKEEVEPWGIWSFRFKQVGLAGGGDAPDITNSDPYVAERGYASAAQVDNDIEIRSGFRAPDGSYYDAMQAKVLAVDGNKDNIKFVSLMSSEDNGQQDDEYSTGQTSGDYVFSGDLALSGNISNSVCRDRNNTWETNWDHSLFDYATGQRFQLENPGFEFQAQNKTNIYGYGNVGQWGVWLSGEPRAAWTLDPSEEEQIVTIAKSYGDLAEYTLTLTHGKLTKTGRVEVTANPSHKLRTYAYNSTLNYGYDIYVKWDNINSKFIPYSATPTAQETSDAIDLNTQLSNQLGWANGNYTWSRWFHDETDNASLYMTLSADSNDTDFAQSGIPVYFEKDVRDRVDGSTSAETAILFPASDSAAAHFLCTDNCLSPTSTSVNNSTVTISSYPITKEVHNSLVSSSGQWRSVPKYQPDPSATPARPYQHYYLAPANSTTYLPGTLYRDKTGNGLTTDDEAVIFDFYQNWRDETATQYTYAGSSTNRVNRADVMSMQIFQITSGCSATQIINNNTCRSSVQYHWDTGQQNWHLGTILLDNSGDAYAVSEPLQLKATYFKNADRNKNTTGDPNDPTGDGKLAYTIPYGYWNQPTGESCTTSDGCSYVYDLEDINGMEISTSFDGRQLNSVNIKDKNLNDWMRLLNPADGQIVFTDVNDATKQYVAVSNEREEALLPAPSSSCNSISFSSAMTDFSIVDIPGAADNTNYPLPTHTWDEKPTIDESCVVREGEEEGNCT